jgi:hypothetical protein
VWSGDCSRLERLDPQGAVEAEVGAHDDHRRSSPDRR